MDLPVRSDDTVRVTAQGSDGPFDLEPDRDARTTDVQSLIGQSLFMEEADWGLIDISFAGCKPLHANVQPFAGLTEPEDGFVIQYRVVGRIPRLLKKARLKGLMKRTRLLRTPLHIAVGIKDIQTCKELLAEEGFATALLNACDVFGDTPLMLASIMGELDIVKLLLKMNADTQHKNPMGRSALMLAAEMGHENVASALLDAGADFRVDTMTNWKKQIPLRTSPYSGAEINHRDEIIQLLSDHEADLHEAEAEARAEAENEAERELEWT